MGTHYSSVLQWVVSSCTSSWLPPVWLLPPSPPPRPMLTLTTAASLPPGLLRTDGESSQPATGAVVTTLARGVPRLILTTDTDTLLPSSDPDTESASSTPVDTPPSTSLGCTKGRLRLSLRPMLTTDTVSDTDIIWDTMVWDTPMADTMAMDTVMDMDTATMDKPGACAIYFLF